MNLTADTEALLPLANTYQSWAINAEDTTAPPGTYTRGLPWFKRTCLGVRGWVHVWSDSYFTSSAEALALMQIERFRTDPTLGVVLGAPNELATNQFQEDTKVYWRWQRHMAHRNTWTSPDTFTIFKHSVFVNAKFRMALDEMEVPTLRVTWRHFLGSSRLFVRPFLRCLLTTG